MDDAEDCPSMEGQPAKRVRLQDLHTPLLNSGSHTMEAVVPASRQPAMQTKALRSVLKGVRSSALLALIHYRLLTFCPICSVCCQGR